MRLVSYLWCRYDTTTHVSQKPVGKACLGPATASNKIAKLLTEVVMFECKPRINDGLSLDGRTRLRELSTLMAEHLSQS
jgi:hypothetical protein